MVQTNEETGNRQGKRRKSPARIRLLENKEADRQGFKMTKEKLAGELSASEKTSIRWLDIHWIIRSRKALISVAPGCQARIRSQCVWKNSIEISECEMPWPKRR